jgi:hypothetical protein
LGANRAAEFVERLFAAMRSGRRSNELAQKRRRADQGGGEQPRTGFVKSGGAFA